MEQSLKMEEAPKIEDLARRIHDLENAVAYLEGQVRRLRSQQPEFASLLSK